MPPPDCNGNGIDDAIDIAQQTSQDCNSNGIPDECEADCDGNGYPDDCDIAKNRTADCNENGVPDSCDLDWGISFDCNENGIPDECDIDNGTSTDENNNHVPDECEWGDGGSDAGLLLVSETGGQMVALKQQDPAGMSFADGLGNTGDVQVDDPLTPTAGTLEYESAAGGQATMDLVDVQQTPSESALYFADVWGNLAIATIPAGPSPCRYRAPANCSTSCCNTSFTASSPSGIRAWISSTRVSKFSTHPSVALRAAGRPFPAPIRF